MSASLPLPGDLDDQALYHHPFQVVEESYGATRSVIASTKLRPGGLDLDRYYIDFTTLDGRHTLGEAERVLDRLWFPERARTRFREAFARLGRLRFIGVGPSHGRMAYRAYVGFSDHMLRREDTAVSFDWSPDGELLAIKHYDEPGSVPDAEKVAAVAQALSAAEPAGLAREVERLIGRIIAQARGDLALILVREADSPRNSVAFNYYRCAHTRLADLADAVEGLVAAFGTPATSTAAWRAASADLRITDLAVGAGWDGQPFVTFYQGMLSRPPALIRPSGANHPPLDGEIATSYERTSAMALDDNLIDLPADPAQLLPQGDGHKPCSACAEAAAAAETDAPRQLPSSGPQPIYALGRVGFEFASEARRESFVQAGLAAPNDPGELLRFLDQHPYAAEDVVWTLLVGSTPIYVLRPAGAYAATVYERLRGYLAAQVEGKTNVVAVPGYMGGVISLSNGAKLPQLLPDLRGFFSWRLEEAAQAVVPESAAARAAPKGAARSDWRAVLGNFLSRLHFELRNTGLRGDHRALNFTATHAFMTHGAFIDAINQDLGFDSFSVEPSAFSPPGSECYDVALTFFHPKQRLEVSRLVYRYTVDVSDVIPVVVGEPLAWRAY